MSEMTEIRSMENTHHHARSEEEKKKLPRRLAIIEGQVRGLEKMIENDTYCPDILTQVAAVTSALNSFGRELLNRHIRECVKDDIIRGDESSLEELIDVLGKMM